jgi:hypothetical protein
VSLARQTVSASLLVIAIIVFSTVTRATSAPQDLFLLDSIFDPSTNSQAGAQQGYSVAADGDLVVVGAPYHDVGSGIVYVYDSSKVSLLCTLTNPTRQAEANFGSAVAISGTRVVIGAHHYSTNDGYWDSRRAGIVYVYDMAGTSPTVPVAALSEQPAFLGHHFGIAVSISGNLVVAGTFDECSCFPAAYVFDLNSPTPASPIAVFTNAMPADHLGFAVSVSGRRVAVAAPYSDTGGTDSGKVYVYDLDSEIPTAPSVTLVNPSQPAGDNFGYSVALSGNQLIVGAPHNDSGAPDSGRAYVYNLGGVVPAIPVAALANPAPNDNGHFGWSVATSGSQILVGAPNADTSGVFDTGVAYLYDSSSGVPVQPPTTVTNPTPANGDWYGWSVAIAAGRMVVGAPYQTGTFETGSAYLYYLTADTYAPLYTPSEASNDRFGLSMAISGERMVVGAPLDDTGATETGVAYVYDLNGVMPHLPVLTLTNPVPQGYEGFGSSVAISGTRVIVGAPYHDEGFSVDAGQAYVYDLLGSTPGAPIATLGGGGQFGWSVAISGTRVVVGAALYPNSGQTYVYDLTSSTSNVPVLTIEKPGWSVVASGTYVVVGTGSSADVYNLASSTPSVPIGTLTNVYQSYFYPQRLSMDGSRIAAVGSGGVYVYDLTSIMPMLPIVVLRDPRGGSSDAFGASLAISGSRVIVGAAQDDSGDVVKGIPYIYNSGIAYVYDLDAANPSLPIATLKNPSPAVEDRFGTSVAINGMTAIASAPFDDTTGADRGAAYVFSIPPTLRISPASSGFAAISWTPVDSPGYVLQFADSLTTPHWADAPSGSKNPVTVRFLLSSRFYRVWKK